MERGNDNVSLAEELHPTQSSGNNPARQMDAELAEKFKLFERDTIISRLQNEMFLLKKENERKISDLNEEHAKKIEALKLQHEKEYSENRVNHEREVQALKEEHRFCADRLLYMEEEHETELRVLNTQYIGRLKAEQQQTNEQNDEKLDLQRRLDSLQKKLSSEESTRRDLVKTNEQNQIVIAKNNAVIAEMEEAAKIKQDENRSLRNTMEKGQEDITYLKTLTMAQEHTIHKIRQEIEPSKQQVKELESKLRLEKERSKACNKTVEELRHTIAFGEAVKEELQEERKRSADYKTLLERYCCEMDEVLHKGYNHSMLLAAIKKLHANQVVRFRAGTSASTDIVNEQLRDRCHFIEKQNAELKRKLNHKIPTHSHEIAQIMRDNMYLIEEVNSYRSRMKPSKVVKSMLNRGASLHHPLRISN